MADKTWSQNLMKRMSAGTPTVKHAPKQESKPNAHVDPHQVIHRLCESKPGWNDRSEAKVPDLDSDDGPLQVEELDGGKSYQVLQGKGHGTKVAGPFGTEAQALAMIDKIKAKWKAAKK